MSFHLQNDDSDDKIMSEINMTPMVDVMLVLLIIFIITLPVIQQAALKKQKFLWMIEI